MRDTRTLGIVLVRVAVAATLVIHGVARVSLGIVDDFGVYLTDVVGIPLGHALAQRVDGRVFFRCAPPRPTRCGEEDPIAEVAVRSGRVDLAIVWGPLAGYFARRQRVDLALVPVPSGKGDLPSGHAALRDLLGGHSR